MEMREKHYHPAPYPQQVIRTQPTQKGIGEALRCTFVATTLPLEMEMLLSALDTPPHG